MQEIKIDKTETVTTHVEKENTALAMGSGELLVFSTPSMVALMEAAACACLVGFLEENETSVGTAISVKHTAASKLGSLISAKATIVKYEGRKVEFIISAYDDIQEIGTGTHTRFIVDETRFMQKIGKLKN